MVQLVLLALQDNQGIEDSLVFQEILAQLVIRDNQAPLDRTVLKDYQVIVDLKEQQDLRETQVPKDREDYQVHRVQVVMQVNQVLLDLGETLASLAVQGLQAQMVDLEMQVTPVRLALLVHQELDHKVPLVNLVLQGFQVHQV